MPCSFSLDGCDHLEAIRRFSNPEPVAGGTVIGVALVGIAINTATAPHVHVGPKGDLNIRGAFLQADAGYRRVVLAGIAIIATGYGLTR